MKQNINPTVSVIIPTFNRARKLARAVRSVLAQTFQDWELIVVDDASVDDTHEVISAFPDERIRYLLHGRNCGPSSARNTGIEAARGAYIAFLDSDDEWCPGKLADDVSVFHSNGEDVGLVYSGEIILDAHGRSVNNLPTLQGRVYDQLLMRDFIGTCSRVTIRKKAVETVGNFDDTLTNEEDWDLWLRIARVFNITSIRKYAVKHHVGHNQLTSTPGSLRRIYEGRAGILRKHSAQMPPSVLAKHLGEQAGLLLNYDIPKARELLFESLRANVLQPRLVGALIVSLLGVRTYRTVFSQWTGLRHSGYLGRARL